MPKLIDYPRTSYTGAWELAEITDDTGGKCTIETAARKLNRKVSGSFKAIIGSAVKFGLITSKRELLTTTTLFKRIKHAYDKQEELAFHREAFLTPPLFTQICRKFRSRELPVQMLDVMLIREFGVEEINAQGVAKAFVDGCRMVGLLDEHNTMADIDAFASKQPLRQQAAPAPRVNMFHPEDELSPTPKPTRLSNDALHDALRGERAEEKTSYEGPFPEHQTNLEPSTVGNTIRTKAVANAAQNRNTDAIASLFGFTTNQVTQSVEPRDENPERVNQPDIALHNSDNDIEISKNPPPLPTTLQTLSTKASYQIQIQGPGVSTELSINEEEDITLAIAILEKIRRQIKG
ncbi:hypothetical protein KB206_10905 [Microvirga sp. STS02]|uniref:hypothetical protein n=1 Tax=Hymenobacter negativus TaxID=2795026 RepID=UPI0018DB8ABC|nr:MULTISPECIES: hypothetical protein [Bacteria]MBH8569395.1 hypothetical protein [Hymenobacter negativus]MBR7209130.1 hypothetical protein [Microvirga sp. STS02]